MALEALRGEPTTAQLAAKHGIHQTMVSSGPPCPVASASSEPLQPSPEPVTAPPNGGLNAVIDISHTSTVTDFNTIRASGILSVLHKATEGGDWYDPLYAERRVQAQRAGLLWGAYHFGTHQCPGAQQATTFLAAMRSDPATLMTLDFEPSERNPGNTMTVEQAEDFVRTLYQMTGRLPLVYTHPTWANGELYGRARLTLDQPISSESIRASCDLWLASYSEHPEIPTAWARRGWRF